MSTEETALTPAANSSDDEAVESLTSKKTVNDDSLDGVPAADSENTAPKSSDVEAIAADRVAMESLTLKKTVDDDSLHGVPTPAPAVDKEESTLKSSNDDDVVAADQEAMESPILKKKVDDNSTDKVSTPAVETEENTLEIADDDAVAADKEAAESLTSKKTVDGDGASGVPAVEEGKIALMSADEEVFVVERDVAMECVTLKKMMEDETYNRVIPLPRVTGATLAKVLEYNRKRVEMKVHDLSNARSRRANAIRKELKARDSNFVKVNHAMLMDLIEAANYLHIESLLDLTCKCMADMIKGKSAEQIRKMFNIKNNITPEEEELIRKENDWAFEVAGEVMSEGSTSSDEPPKWERLVFSWDNSR